MHGLYVEHRLKGSSTVSEDLVKHMYTRMLQGSVAIVAGNPLAMLSVVRKRWLKIERQLRRQRSSTLDARRILEVTQEIIRVQTLKFTAKPLADDPIGDVHVATIQDFVLFPPMCRTLYVTHTITTEQLHLVTSWMPKGGLVVVYDKGIEAYEPAIPSP
jgi:hypothetical protein